MSPTTQSLLLSNIAIGTIITMSSHHWLLAWMGLELNTLAMLPIISATHHPRATEASTKYFLTQAAASSLILFASILNAQPSGQWDIMQLSDPLAKVLFTMALAMKLGLSPTHFWLPEVLQGSPLKTSLIIVTWQKLAPMTLLYLTYNQTSTPTLITIGIISVLVGGLGGLNQTQLRKMLAFSSISHLGWMATIMTTNPNLSLLSLAVYILITTPTFLSMILLTTKTIKDLGASWTTSPTLISLTMMLLLSLGGLPPLTGFLPKWLILQELTINNTIVMATGMALMTLLNLFFYLRLTYTMTLTLTPNVTTNTSKWRFNTTQTTPLMTTGISLSLLALPLMPLVL
uniref:NADH-ubiquinone oxidoreductase chain 2 n=1 Tax=Xenosaurus grandis TaxID=52183 RepID=P92770_9SAUR|nr:NADH dehydrogenase subunit II [Xenosaurus grandis]